MSEQSEVNLLIITWLIVAISAIAVVMSGCGTVTYTPTEMRTIVLQPTTPTITRETNETTTINK